MRALPVLAAACLLWPASAQAAVPLPDTAHALRSKAGKPGLAVTALVLTARMMSYKASHDAAASVPGAMTARGRHDADMRAREDRVRQSLDDFLSGSPSAPLPTLQRARTDLGSSVAGMSRIIGQDPLPADPAAADSFHQKALEAMYSADQAVQNFEYARRAAVPTLEAMAEDASARYALAARNPRADPKELSRLAAQAADLSRMQNDVDRGLADATRLGAEDSLAAAALVPDGTALALAAAVQSAVGEVQADLASAESKPNPDSGLTKALGYTRKTLGRGMREWSTIGGSYIPSADEGGLLSSRDRHSAVAVTTANRDTLAALAAINQVARLTAAEPTP